MFSERQHKYVDKNCIIGHSFFVMDSDPKGQGNYFFVCSFLTVEFKKESRIYLWDPKPCIKPERHTVGTAMFRSGKGVEWHQVC